MSAWIAHGGTFVLASILLVGCGGSSEPSGRSLPEGPTPVFIDADPSFSSDGGRIAFVRGGTEFTAVFALHIVDVGTGRVHRLIREGIGGESPREPDWSADDSWISFTSGADSLFCNEDDSVALVRPDGSGFRLLSPGCGARWAPAGDLLAFLVDYNLWVGGPDEAPRLLFKPGPITERNGITISENVWAFDWAPDGRRLVFQRGNELWIVRADGSGLRKLRDVVSHAPDWSSDGRWIAFGRYEGGVDGHERIWVVRPDGTDAHPLTEEGEERSDPSWSPDGTELLVYGSDGPVLVTPAGEQRPAPGDGVWSPDGAMLVSGGSTAGGLSPDPRPLVAAPVHAGAPRRLTQR